MSGAARSRESQSTTATATAPKRSCDRPACTQVPLPQLAGNFAMQRFVQASLRVGHPGDPQEHEAERVASAVSCGGCNEAVPCGACAEQKKIRRSAKNGAPASALSLPQSHIARLGSGAPLDAALRARMQHHLGHDLSRVRVHTGSQASRVARSIDARAFTAGHDVVFDHGEFRPGTTEGDRLLAHELTHVVQNGGEAETVRRVVNGDVRTQSITDTWARDLTDEELPQQIDILNREIPLRAEGSPERQAAEANLAVLRADYRRRHPDTAAPGQLVPRPPGLPLGGAYQLQPIDLPSDVLGGIPEGQLVTVTGGGFGVGSVLPDRPSTVASSIAGGTWAGLRTSLSTYGFAAAGENAIGIVAFPRYAPGRFLAGMSSLVPEHPVLWGHTAVYVRQGGRIVAVRSYAPASLLQAARVPGVVSGMAEVPAGIYSEAGAFDIFNVSNARSVEWAAAPDEVAAMLEALPEGRMYGMGRAMPSGAQYTAVPGASQACTGTSCIGWAFEQAGPRTQGLPQDYSQGRLIRAMTAMEGGEGVAVGGLSRGMQVLKWGGRAMLVVGIVMVPVEVALARPEDRVRTGIGATSGFFGGLAGGAAAGLVCGPGALLCSVVLGIGFGVAGAFGARAVAEGIYDSATAPRPEQVYRPPCPGQGRCHEPNRPRVDWNMSQLAGPGLFGAVTARSGHQQQLTESDVAMIRRWLATQPATQGAQH